MNSLQLAGTSFTDALQSMREDSLRIDAELKQKRAAANAEVERLRNGIAELRQEQSQLTRSLKELRDQVDRERREVGKAKAV
jgi:hypothetical protein